MKNDHRVLNRLIVACNDDIHAQTSAAAVVSGSGKRDRLNDSARRRETFVDELVELVRAGGGRPTQEGATFGESLRGSFRQLRALVIGHNTGDAYGWCTQVGGSTCAAYERALAGSLPDGARETVRRQYEEIAADGEEFNLQRFGGSIASV
jgi:uncharacterized protein (TIGR02284 family)